MVEEFKALFSRLLAELPPGTASLNVYCVPKGDGTVIELKPTNARSAFPGVHLEDQVALVDFSFGIGTWELPFEGRNKSANEKELLSEVEQMCRAVIDGHCEEIRGFFSLTSKIYVDGYTYTVTDLPMLPIPPFGVRKFAPFVSNER